MNQSTINRALLWFQINKRDEPWREKPTPYRVWISEMMLQQTTVATVKNYFLRFMNRFPRLDDLAQASEDEVLHLWAGLGYYSRARNILKTAQLIQKEEFFPRKRDQLLKLPGIGPYTSAAITSIACNEPDALVDTNVDRVLGRFMGMMRTEDQFMKKIEIIAQEIMDQVAANKPEDIWIWNQVLMEIGALLCSTTKAQCAECPLVGECLAFKSGNPVDFPGMKVKPTIIEMEEICLVIKKGDEIVLSKNVEGRRKGLFDFKIIKEVKNYEMLGQFTYRISNNKVTRKIVILNDDSYELHEHEVCVRPEECQKKYPITSSCKKVVENFIFSKNK
ncbi:MAG: A/G-specific adenine glycosylase [Brevinema sp.]